MYTLHALPFTWFVIIAFCVVMYVILDGFTLGTGILVPWMSSHERNLAMSVILPTWDGNQTWLVLGGASLYAAFPIAFSTLLPILYLPIILMVVMLLFRGVCFEFRLKSKAGRPNWDRLFTLASVVVTFIQGAALGTFVQGFSLQTTDGVLPAFEWFTPFSVTTGLGLICGYALLGSTRLILKTEGEFNQKMRKAAKVAAGLVALFMVIVSIWSPMLDTAIHTRWFNPAHIYYLAILPLLAGLMFIALWYSLGKRNDVAPYWCAFVMFICGYIGLGITVWPYIVPRHITIAQAAAPDGALKFILVGACIMIPVLLAYTGYAYRIFRGKVNDVLEY